MEMVEKYSESTKRIYELLKLADTPSGFFKCLDKLLNALRSDDASAYRFKKWTDGMTNEEEKMEKIKEEVVNWMREKLSCMRKLPHTVNRLSPIFMVQQA